MRGGTKAVSDDHLFKLAKEESKFADYCGATDVQIGCVVVYHGTILAKGHNSDKTHTTQKQYNRWRYKQVGVKYLPAKTHSEIDAITKIKYLDIDFSKVHLYIYREFANGAPAMARPCEACMAAIDALKIKHIHYTTNGGYAYERRV